MANLNYSLRNHFIGVLFVLSASVLLAGALPYPVEMFYLVAFGAMIFFGFWYYYSLYKSRSIVTLTLSLAAISVVMTVWVFVRGTFKACFLKTCSDMADVDVMTTESPGLLAVEFIILVMILTYWLVGKDLGLR
jgi:hypothetical protein